MLHTIENDYLKVTVSDHGAELTSVYDKAQDFERIWCADPAVWNRHAPVLFPFVGKVKDGAYRYNGNTYTMKTQHGFARDAEFTCIAETTDSITHKLVYSDETLEIYPFEFELLITHRFDADKKPFVTLTCTDFPYVGIWSKPDGPYVCLEPWLGRTDNMDFTGDLAEKPGEQKLIANAEAVHTYTIEFHSSI